MNHSIQLFIHDSFFDSFSLLPKPIQKRTREFLKKFKDNPTSSAINLEKILDFVDQSLRTVKINDKYRAVVQAPEKGDSFHLLWVDNHDEAMAWARNKIFEWNKKTQGFQLFEQPEVIQELDEAPTIIDNALFDSYSNEDLLAIGVPEVMIPLVRSIMNMEELNVKKSSLPVDAFEYLYYLAEGIPLTEILEDIDAGKATVNPMQSSNALKHAFVLTDDVQLEEVLNGSFEKWKIFLHPSQRNLSYRDYNGPVKVTGGAGTGKTVCALHRTKYLVDKLGIFDSPILFSTYTKSLTLYLNETIKSLNIAEGQVEILNIDKLIYDLANDQKYKIFKTKVGFLSSDQEKQVWLKAIERIPSQFDENFYFSEYNEVILPQNILSLETYLTASRIGRSTRIGRKDKEEIWTVIEAFQKEKSGNFSKLELCNLLTSFFISQKNKPYSFVICDEIQDFSNSELSLLRSLVNDKENDMFLVGDPFQNIYKKTQNFLKSGIVVKGRRSRKLKLNYRTTDEIKQLAVGVVSKVKVDDFDGNEDSLKGYLSLLHGDRPSYQVFSKPEDEDKFMLEKIKSLIAESSILPNEICICTRTNTKLDDVKKMLNADNVKYLDLSSPKQNINAINVSTFHNIKGHEFKVVFIKDVSESTVPLKHAHYDGLSEREKVAYELQERSLIYVVLSRAIQSVFITGVGEKSEWIEKRQ